MAQKTRIIFFALVVVLICVPGSTQVDSEIGSSTQIDSGEMQPKGAIQWGPHYRHPSAKKLYMQLEDSFDVRIQFDPGLQDQQVDEDIEGLELEEALEVIAIAAGYFYKVLDEGTILVVRDTPQNRREYEELMIKTFVLHNASPRAIDKVLRSLIEARRLVVTEDIPAVTIRDTKSKIEIAERLIALFDRPRSEIDIDIEILEFGRTDLENALQRNRTTEGGVQASPIRMNHKEFEDFKTKGRASALSETSLSLIQGKRSLYRDHSSLDIDFDLVVSGRVHTDTSEVTLDTQLNIARRPSTAGTQAITSSMRLAQGTTYVLTGLTGATMSLDDRVLVVALTPHIIRTCDFKPGELEELHVGTESRISFGPTLELFPTSQESQ